MQTDNQHQIQKSDFASDKEKARLIVNKLFKGFNLMTIILLIVVSIPLFNLFNNVILDDLASPNSRILSLIPLAFRQ